MKIMDIHSVVANCYSLTSNQAVSPASWAGRNVQSFAQQVLNGAAAFSDKMGCVASKCSHFINTIFSGACMYANAGWQIGKYAGARGWECAKIGMAYGAQAGAALVSKFIALGQCVLSALGTAYMATKNLALTIAVFSVEKLAQLGVLLKNAFCAAGAGAMQGIQITHSFAASHPKEICIFGAALTIGLAIGYAAASMKNYPTAPELA